MYAEQFLRVWERTSHGFHPSSEVAKVATLKAAFLATFRNISKLKLWNIRFQQAFSGYGFLEGFADRV